MSDDILDRFLQEISKDIAPIPEGDRTLDRLPTVFVIDRSGSTQQTGDIAQINAFLKRFAESVSAPTSPAWKRIQAHLNLCVIAYGDNAEEILPWTPGEQITPARIPTLAGAGYTHMAAGLEQASRAMLQCLADFRKRQISAYRGYIFNVTDGNPTDMWPESVPDSTNTTSSTAERISKEQRWKRVKGVLDGLEKKSSTGAAYASTYHCASRSANQDVLRMLAYSPDRMLDLEQANFDKLFEFIRISLLMAVDETAA